MSPRPSDGPRSGHTFYLTPECWDALDEAHSEQRRKARRTGQPDHAAAVVPSLGPGC